MPDYCMCKGDDCAQRNKCFRFRARPNRYRQSYFMDVPGPECEHFMDIERWPERMLTEVPGEEVTFGGSVQQTGVRSGPYQGPQLMK